VVFEFYVYVKSYDYRIAAVGLLLYGMAFGIRRWGMKALGKQWAIHAVGAQKIKKVRLVKIGPYKYIRHPIYLGILLEVTSLALVANATAGLLFALLVNVPLQIIRAYFEEKTSYHRFGERYLQYKNEVSMIFPLKWLHRHLRSW
jgi:protein-S-isoprenylcysteine O-methyltransferase Ste14